MATRRGHDQIANSSPSHDLAGGAAVIQAMGTLELASVSLWRRWVEMRKVARRIGAISAIACGSVVRLRPGGFGETSRRSAQKLPRAEADGSPYWTISATGSSGRPRKSACSGHLRQGFASGEACGSEKASGRLAPANSSNAAIRHSLPNRAQRRRDAGHASIDEFKYSGAAWHTGDPFD
jgi:hypothetical protein